MSTGIGLAKLLTDLSCVLCCPRRCLLLGVELSASEVGLRLPFAVGCSITSNEEAGDWAKSAPNAPWRGDGEGKICKMQVLTLPGIWTV
ncbi:hypothetical protein C8Q80DRAFT_1153030, partial [Daedaleopsis nitida]